MLVSYTPLAKDSPTKKQVAKSLARRHAVIALRSLSKRCEKPLSRLRAARRSQRRQPDNHLSKAKERNTAPGEARAALPHAVAAPKKARRAASYTKPTRKPR